MTVFRLTPCVDSEPSPTDQPGPTVGEPVRYRRSESCLWRSFADEVLLAGADSQFQALSGTSADVWSLLDEPMRPDEIVDALADAYRSPPEVIGRDLVALLHELARLGYVDEVPDE